MDCNMALWSVQTRRCRGALGHSRELLHARLVLLVQNQTVEDGEHLLPVTVYFLQRLAEVYLEIRSAEPLFQHIPRHVDILTQIFDTVAAKEQSVEKRGLPLRSQGIEIISRRH